MKVRALLSALLAVLWVGTAHAVEVQRVVSPGGIEAWLVEDHANPIVSMRFAFAGGAELDPPGKEGLANLVAATLDEGAGPLDSQAFQRRLADEAIELRFDAGFDVFSGQLRTLSSTLEDAIELLRLALTQPRFDDEPVARLKSQILAGIRRDSEDPDKIAYETLFAGFFPGHGYGRRVEGTEQSVAALTPADLAGFVVTRLARANLTVGVVGDITPEKLGRVLDQAFGALPVQPSLAPVTDVTPRATGRLEIIDRDIVQSAIVFGHGGPRRDDPDYYAVLLMNHILGGGSFTSRLYDEVREKRGLAYSVGSRLYPLDHAGLIIGSAGTENARVGETIALIRAEWARMAAGDVTEQELNDAKTYVTGSFPLSFTSTDKIARVLVAMQVNDLGLDYLDRRNDYIEAVTLADVKRVAAKYLTPEKLDIVVVGRPEGLLPNP